MTQYSFIKWLCMQAITIGWRSKSNKKLTNIIFLISFVFPICALGVMFVIKVVNNSFALFGSLHYKVLVCCKTAADFSREIYFMRRTFTLSESQKTRDLLPPTAPPPSMPRVLMTICFWGSIYIISCLLYSDCIIGDTHPSLTHFNQFLGCIANGFCLYLASLISGLRCFRINTISTASSSPMWEFDAVKFLWSSPLAPHQVKPCFYHYLYYYGNKYLQYGAFIICLLLQRLNGCNDGLVKDSLEAGLGDRWAVKEYH